MAWLVPAFALLPSTQRRMGQNPLFQQLHADIDSGKPSAYHLEQAGLPAWTSRAWKIRIPGQGLYRLTHDRLKSAGVTASIRGSDLRLWCMGREIATWVSQEGGWRPGDSMVFYAESFAGSHTRENAVWLTHAPPPDGQPAFRMETGREAAYDPRAFTSARAEDALATPAVHRASWQPAREKSGWFAGVIGRQPFETRFHASRPASPANPALVLQLEDGLARWFQKDAKSLTCVVDGASRRIRYQNPGRANPDGDAAEVRIPLSGLNANGTDLRLEKPEGEALLRWAALRYDRILQPQNDGTLCFDTEVDDTSTFQLKGFEPNTTWVLDVDDVFHPRVLPLSSRSQFLGSSSVYYVCPFNRIKEPSVQSVSFLQVRPSEGGEALVIVDPTVFPSVSRYAAYRSSRGTPCRVVSLPRIIDTFGFGINDPGAIRRFIGHVYHHGGRPRSVLLIGDGSLDPLGFLGPVEADRFPAIIGPGVFERGTQDGWFASVDGADMLPDLPVGRIPADNDGQFQMVLEKVKAYEAESAAGWKHQAFWASDKADLAGNFRATVTSLKGIQPGWSGNETAHIDELDATTVATRLRNAFDGRYGHLTYVGHGFATGLGFHGGKYLFDAEDARSLRNRHHPIFTALSCSAGNFHEPGVETLGEALLFQPHGAVAVMASPGKMALLVSEIMGETFMREGSGGRVRTLGELLLAGKQNLFYFGSTAATVQQFGLLGDPNLELPRRSAARSHSPSLEITARDREWFRLEWDSVPGLQYRIATCGDLASEPFSTGRLVVPSAGQRTSIWLRPGPHAVCSYRLVSEPDAR